MDKRTAYLAAKSGLGNTGFFVKRASYEKGVVLATHRMTRKDWGITAGVYVKNDAAGTLIKIIVEGSKDLGFEGDDTASTWTHHILKEMRNYIFIESQILDSNRKVFQ